MALRTRERRKETVFLDFFRFFPFEVGFFFVFFRFFLSFFSVTPLPPPPPTLFFTGNRFLFTVSDLHKAIGGRGKYGGGRRVLAWGKKVAGEKKIGVSFKKKGSGWWLLSAVTARAVPLNQFKISLSDLPIYLFICLCLMRFNCCFGGKMCFLDVAVEKKKRVNFLGF